MNSSLSSKVHYGIAALAGLCWAASFPKLNVAGLAWIAPGLILLVAMGQGSGRTFQIGYVAGLAHYLTSLYWLLLIPFPVGAVAGWLALSGYLALYPAAWVWLCWKLFPVAAVYDRRGNDSISAGALRGPLRPDQVLATSWWQRALWAMQCAAVWVALEMIVGRFLSGFPWNFLGVSQYRVLPLIQIASITGVYGVSFFVVWFSASLAMVALRLTRQAPNRWAWLAELRLALVGLVVVASFGIQRVLPPERTERELTLALVQPSIRQELIWDHREDANRFNKIVEMSQLALANKPDLLVWPEAAMPGFNEQNFHTITDLVAAHKVWMILGADDAERHPTAQKPDDYDSFNAAFLFNPAGKFVARYRKQRLVIFGEYVPFARWLPFLRSLIPVPGDFTPGNGPVPFEVGPLAAVADRRTDDNSNQRPSPPAATERVKLSVLICFEDVFPHLVRHYVDDNTDFLLNLTNDGWFGESAAHWQQAANAVFRAVENGLPLVRCTNNGLTCWVDSRGRLRQTFSAPNGNVYGAGFMTVRVPLLADGQKRVPTFYNRHGDWFGWGCVASVAIVVAARRNQRSARRPGAQRVGTFRW